jgi:hypothetical protein
MKRPHLVPFIDTLRARRNALTQIINTLEQFAQDHIDRKTGIASMTENPPAVLLSGTTERASDSRLAA